jgi:CheY-like chemotaxis protein
MDDCITTAPLVVDGDRSEFEQVVLNLVLNAKDAMPTGGRLTVEVRADAGRAVLVVRDTGVGIPEQVRPRIFDPFFSTKPPGQGSGLGLAVAYGVVTKRGGSIDVVSATGAGTTFTVSLPLSTQGAPSAGSASVHGLVGRGTVLLVDDDPLVRSTTRRLLERAGWGVHEAADGVAGLAAFAAAPGAFAVVLSDVRMPELSGPALVRKLRALDATIPVVLFSGYDRLEGPDDVLPEHVPLLRKPFRPDELLHALAVATTARS